MSTDARQLFAYAITHCSNICAILSDLGQHPEALSHARNAVYFCKQGLAAMLPQSKAAYSANDDVSSTATAAAAAADYDVQTATGQPVMKMVSALAVACYNLAVEVEHCEGGACVQWYQRARGLARHADAAEAVLAKVEAALASARRRYAVTPQQQQQQYGSSGRHSGTAEHRRERSAKIEPRRVRSTATTAATARNSSSSKQLHSSASSAALRERLQQRTLAHTSDALDRHSDEPSDRRRMRAGSDTPVVLPERGNSTADLLLPREAARSTSAVAAEQLSYSDEDLLREVSML